MPPGSPFLYHGHHIASIFGSPRRREILENFGFPLLVRPTETDESLRDYLPADERVVELALDKARTALAAAKVDDPRWVLAADTLVSIDGRVLGKARDRAEARDFLRSLAGVSHTVSTGLALADRLTGGLLSILEETEVRFARLSGEEDRELPGHRRMGGRGWGISDTGPRRLPRGKHVRVLVLRRGLASQGVLCHPTRQRLPVEVTARSRAGALARRVRRNLPPSSATTRIREGGRTERTAVIRRTSWPSSR